MFNNAINFFFSPRIGRSIIRFGERKVLSFNTYFQKTADPKDIAPSMAMGFTMNHIAAVVLPVVGGFLWIVDYRIPFMVGAGLSFISLLAIQKIKT